MANDRRAWALFLFAMPAAAASRGVPPPAEELLRAALTTPARTSTTRVRVQSFDRVGAAKAQYHLVSRGPNGVRIEASAMPRGPLALIEITDGKSRLQAWPKMKRAWLGPAPPIDVPRETARLLARYHLFVAAGGRTTGKSVWRLDLLAKSDGSLRRSLWIAKKDSLLLRREDYRRDGTLLRRERVTRLEMPDENPAHFIPVLPTDAAMIDLHSTCVAGWTPEGVVLLSARNEKEGATLVYSDGLVEAILTETPSGGSAAGYALSDVGGATRVEWRTGGHAYALTGDFPEADLLRMADSVVEAR